MSELEAAVTTLCDPSDLAAGGRALWDAIIKVHTLDAAQEIQLLEACRAKDRLDKLDLLLRGDADVWARLVHRVNTEDYELVIDKALEKSNATANLMKQLLAAMRLPDETSGKRPQVRSARGSYAPKAPGSVTPLERARARAEGRTG